MRTLCVALMAIVQLWWLCDRAGRGRRRELSPAPDPLVVLFPPGGSDTVARMFGQRAGERLGQPFVIDNRPGAAGVIGADIVAKSPADGYTLLFATASFAMTSAWDRKLPYDANRDFTAIGMLAYTPFMLTVHPTLPVNSVKEFIALAKAKPDQLNVSTTGAGGIGHLASAMFASMAGINSIFVPYKGTGPALTAALAGEVNLTWSPSAPRCPMRATADCARWACRARAARRWRRTFRRSRKPACRASMSSPGTACRRRAICPPPSSTCCIAK